MPAATSYAGLAACNKGARIRCMTYSCCMPTSALLPDRGDLTLQVLKLATECVERSSPRRVRACTAPAQGTYRSQGRKDYSEKTFCLAVL